MLNRICTSILLPVRRFPIFLGVLCGLCSLTPIVLSITTGQRLFTYILLALSGSFCISYLISALLLAVKNKRLRLSVQTLILLVATIWTILEVGTIATTRTFFNVDSFVLISETTLSESMGFMKSYFQPTVLLVYLLAAVLVAAVSTSAYFLSRTRRKLPCIAAASITVLLAAYGLYGLVRLMPAFAFKNYSELLTWEAYEGQGAMNHRYTAIFLGTTPYKAAYMLNSKRLMNKDFNRWEELQIQAWQEECTAKDSLDFNIVLIVGESFIRVHSPLYGYALNTTPFLSTEAKAGHLVPFTNMYTMSNFTTPSLRNAFNLNNAVRDCSSWSDGVYFPMLLSKAGFTCLHFDNQTVSPYSDGGIARMFYSPLNMEHVYTATGDSLFRYDGDFVAYTNRRMEHIADTTNMFVCYHLMGQHFPYSARYPGAGPYSAKDVLRLHPELSAQDALQVAEYDNATAYNDAVVGDILTAWRDRPTVAIYFSDHGEDCPDLGPVEARNKQRPDDAAWVDRQYHIPFMVWMSPSFIKEYPQVADRINNAAGRLGTTGDIGHFILGLCGIASPYYNADADIASEDYIPFDISYLYK